MGCQEKIPKNRKNRDFGHFGQVQFQTVISNRDFGHFGLNFHAATAHGKSTLVFCFKAGHAILILAKLNFPNPSVELAINQQSIVTS
jgi:hypothetical protein